MPASLKQARPFQGLLVVVLAVAAMTVLPAPSASAATCYGTGCNGQYPAETGCYESAGPTRSYNNGAVQIEVWFSTICQTKWSQVYYNDGGPNYLVTGFVGIDFTQSGSTDVPFTVSKMVGASIDSGVEAYVFYSSNGSVTYQDGAYG